MKNETKKMIIKLVISALVIALVIVGAWLLARALGWTELTREELQEYLLSKGVLAPLIFIVITFLQVTLVPIPGSITILAGNYLFGLWRSFLYSYIGLMLGSVVAFAMGRWVGRPFVNWIAGSNEKVEEWLKKLKGKEKILLFFMFFFPFFPDDILCAVAGLLPITWIEFLIMQILTRATSVGGTLLFVSGEFIPYHGWGLFVIILIGIAFIFLFILSMKYANEINEKLSQFADKLTNKSKRNKEK